ncbi:uncharacterized protein A4U43_C10F14990 [Asparagus officinalis]|uniref:Uncharacterized protein n=1 Tax=Asparagus officinalis TaxID=4686 RepID=A0A5P1E345_ASPOF|nr:uncharacterized protein A4U43_C10F14990 [Asparagus officinalis]
MAGDIAKLSTITTTGTHRNDNTNLSIFNAQGSDINQILLSALPSAATPAACGPYARWVYISASRSSMGNWRHETRFVRPGRRECGPGGGALTDDAARLARPGRPRLVVFGPGGLGRGWLRGRWPPGPDVDRLAARDSDW